MFPFVSVKSQAGSSFLPCFDSPSKQEAHKFLLTVFAEGTYPEHHGLWRRCYGEEE